MKWVLKPSSQRRARRPRAECDMISVYWKYTINNTMRFVEFKTIKPLKPLNPAQARIAALRRNVEIARQSLKRERDYQQHQKLLQQQQKLSQQKIKP